MKKILIASLFTIFSFTGFAQVSGGLFAGPNLSWFGVDSKFHSNDGVRLGYTFGAMADFPVFDNFLFTTAVKYNDVGGSLKYEYGAAANLYDLDSIAQIGEGEKISYNLNYLEIPIGFKGKTNEIGFMSYYMKAGIAPMIRLKSIADIATNSHDLFTDNISLFNFNWFMGAGFEWALSGNTRFITEFVYNGGILDFVKKSDNDLTVQVYETANGNVRRDHRGKVNAVALKLGILF
ncbi:MAG: outer membrane beta-barrel protein [Bacteroidota bacterium]